MGMIVRFDRQKKTLALNGTAKANTQPAQNHAGGSGQVLMFTGVRYERNSGLHKARPDTDDAAITAAGISAKNG